MKSWKMIAGLLAAWLLLVLYMSSSLFGIGDNSARMEKQLRRAMEELDLIHNQNLELQRLATELKQLQALEPGDQGEIIQNLQERLQKATNDLKKLTALTADADIIPGVHYMAQDSHQQVQPILSLERESARRKLEYTAIELWYFIDALMKELKSFAADNTVLKQKISDAQSNLQGYHSMMLDDFTHLRKVNGDEKWRRQESMKLGNLIQRRLEFVQNPPNCKTAKYVVCDLHKGCGFGCQLHHVTYCLLVAYATQRTLVLQSKGWRYASRGWESVFQPLSKKCNAISVATAHWGSLNMESAQAIQLPIVDSLQPRPGFMPLAIPEDIANRLKTFHGDPPVWWIGQLVKYLIRPDNSLQEDIQTTHEKMQFTKPIVGVHIRRTDKVGVEAAFHHLNEYMRHVETYYQQRERTENISQRRVYLASDDPMVLNEAKEK